ncbi:hypothetical protein WJX72_009269 [[Myrmecia] bisecta]|uniref:Beta-glucosidase n=1 Tax=[Myrmecia] bisecta TaxID=41462 RepID=A0AAW1PAS1_9CHLO
MRGSSCKRSLGVCVLCLVWAIPSGGQQTLAHQPGSSGPALLDNQCTDNSLYLSELQQEAKISQAACIRTCRSTPAQAATLAQCQAVCQSAVAASPLHNHLTASMPRVAKPSKDYSDVHFVVFFSVGKRGSEKFPTHQYVSPNMKFVPSVRQSHPGAKVVMLTDMVTQFDNLDSDIHLFRFDLDTDKMGRNAWANKFQFEGQIEYMQHLMAAGQEVNLAFIDMDVLVLDDITEVFCDDYAYGFTISADPYDPIDIGTQFVRKGRYNEAIAYLRGVVSSYRLDQIHDFTIGQKVVQGSLQIHNAETAALSQAAFRDNRVCRLVANVHHICLFTCLRYNYFDNCVLYPGGWLPHDADLYRRHDIKMYQFTAWRKPGIDEVVAALARGGIEAAWEAAAALPATEEGYAAMFADFNRNVTKLCWKTDLDCIKAGGRIAEDTEAAARQVAAEARQHAGPGAQATPLLVQPAPAGPDGPVGPVRHNAVKGRRIQEGWQIQAAARLQGTNLVSELLKHYPNETTAAYQVEGAAGEGGRSASIWDTFSHLPGKTHKGDTGDIADDFYHRFHGDIQLMKELGMAKFRLSISWSRVLPEGTGEVNEEGIAFYNQVIDALLAAGIEPFITLYHWDLPQRLADQYGGWLSALVAFDFAAYADVCFKAFGDRVKYWTTFNEPYTFCTVGYGAGIHAPGRCSDRKRCAEGDSEVEPWTCTHNVLLAHASAVARFRKTVPDGRISMNLNAEWAEPLNPKSAADKDAAERHMEWQIGAYADPIFRGDYPESVKARVPTLQTFTEADKAALKDTMDYFAFNHYTSKYATPTGDNQEEVAVLTVRPDGEHIGVQADSDWLWVVPWGFRRCLNWIDHRYSHPTIIVTENGVDVPHEETIPYPQVLNDHFRVDYFQSYLSEAVKAVEEDGVDLQGYFAWSQLDNLEWAEGFSQRFGIVHVDFKHELKRSLKYSAMWLAEFFGTSRQGQDAEAE